MNETATESTPLVQRIINGTPTSNYTTVGLIGDNSGFFCSGTLIDSRYVLTAGHCAEGVGNTAGRFRVNGKTYTTSRVFIHPNYNSQTLANDIAIYELSEDVTGVTPEKIFRGQPVVGQTLTLVGFGAGGDGDSGQNGDFGTKRVGSTTIDRVTARWIRWNFDDNSESNTASGDSGGPGFLTVNGERFLAGITSSGTKNNASIGDRSFDTRVDAFKSWIDRIVGSGDVAPSDPQDDHSNLIDQSATRMGPNGARRGKLELASDRDIFRVRFSGTGRATFALAGTAGLDTYLRVYDSSGKLVAQNDDSGNSRNSRVSMNVKPGWYYLSSGSYKDSQTGKYRISTRFARRRANVQRNRFPTVNQIGLSSGRRRSLFGAIEHQTDLDVFSVKASATGSMGVFLRAAAGNLDAIVSAYRADQTLIGISEQQTGNDIHWRFDVSAGETYYLKVSGSGGTTGTYRLGVANKTMNPRRTDRKNVALTLPEATQNKDLAPQLLSLQSRLLPSNRLEVISDRLLNADSSAAMSSTKIRRDYQPLFAGNSSS